MATVNKNFKIKSGLVVEGATATVAGKQVLTEDTSDQYIIDLIGGETLVTSVESTQMEVISGELNIKSGVFDESGAAAAAQTAAQDFATAADTSLYTTVTSDISTAKSQAISAAATDATSKADAAEASANSYTDDEIGSLDLSLKAYADQAESDAVTTAGSYTDARETAITTAYQSYADTAESDAKAYADQKVSDLVGGAPELLDTLNELAQAISDDANFATTITTSIGTKADTSYVNSEISDLDTAAQGYADDAESSANSYTDGKITQEVADRNSAISTAIDTEVTNRNTAIGAAITQEVADRNSAITSAVNSISTTDIEEGTNLYFTNQRAIDAVGGTIGSQIDLLDTDDIEEGSTNLYFTNSRALSATAAAYDMIGAAGGALEAAEDYADGLAINYDPAGSAATAYSDAVGQAQTFADNAFTNASAYADGVGTAANGYTDGAIGTEVGNRNSAISDAIATEVTNRNDAIALAKGEAIDAAEAYADNAVSALVGSAPELLDTLQELAAALDNDPEAINSLQSIAAGKADASDLTDHIADTSAHGVSGDVVGTTDAQMLSNKSINNNLGFQDPDISSNLGFVSAIGNVFTVGTMETDIILAPGTGKDVKWGADVVATRSYADEIVADVLDGTTAFTEINVNSEAKQIAATSSSLGSVVVTAYSWPKADYRSAKLMVKIDNATDNEVSEILLTLDSSDNIAITEYAIVGTNGSRGSITARVSGANVEVRVDPVNDSTIKVTGTLLK